MKLRDTTAEFRCTRCGLTLKGRLLNGKAIASNNAPSGQDLRKLREAWQDLWYVIARDTRLLRLIRRLGMTEKPWVDEARQRAPVSAFAATKKRG